MGDEKHGGSRPGVSNPVKIQTIHLELVKFRGQAPLKPFKPQICPRRQSNFPLVARSSSFKTNPASQALVPDTSGLSPGPKASQTAAPVLALAAMWKRISWEPAHEHNTSRQAKTRYLTDSQKHAGRGRNTFCGFNKHGRRTTISSSEKKTVQTRGR